MRPHRQFRCHGGHLFKEWSRYVVVAAGPELELCSGHRTDQLYTVPNDQGAAEPDYRGQIYPRTHVGGGRNVPWWWLRGVIAAPIPPFSQSR